MTTAKKQANTMIIIASLVAAIFCLSVFLVTNDEFMGMLSDEESKTFDCNPSADVDYHSLDSCIGIWNTYHFNETLKIKQASITTKIKKSCGQYLNVYVDFLIDGTWTRKATYSMHYAYEHTENLNFVAFNASGIRLRGYQEYCYPEWYYTRGSLLIDVDDIPPVPPPPDPPSGTSIPWWVFAIFGIIVIALIACVGYISYIHGTGKRKKKR